MNPRGFSWLAVAACTLAGCAETRLYSGRAPGFAARGYDDRWHVTYVFGTVGGGNRYDLAALCPNGWSEITVRPDVFTTFAGAVTLFFYSPARLTIVCAASDATTPPEPSFEPRAAR